MLRSEQGQVNGSTGEPSQDGEGTTARSPSRDQLFRELVQQHNKRLYRFIFRHIGHSGDAEDLTQQAFVEAVRVYETYRGEAKLSTWLYGIAINLVRNHLNRSPERIYEFQGTEVLANLDSAALSVEDTICLNAERGAMWSAMAELPTEMREVLLLVGVQELSYEEASALLSIPVGTVRSRLSRARTALRRRMRDGGWGDEAGGRHGR